VIQRVYLRSEDPKVVRFAVCFDGTNQDEILAILNVRPGDAFYILVPPFGGTDSRVLKTVGIGSPDIIDYGIGSWAVQDSTGEHIISPVYENADFVATFSLADAALAP